MAFWILLAWTVSALFHTTAALIGVEVLAALATFSPVIFRRRHS
jgi:dolichol kinase